MHNSGLLVLLSDMEQPEKIKQEEFSTHDKESFETMKLEWGETLGYMGWGTAPIIIRELNRKLKDTEKPWRLPTAHELIGEYNKTSSTPSGFKKEWYWSSTSNSEYCYAINMSDGQMWGFYLSHKSNPPDSSSADNYLVRCVRDLN